MYYLAIAVVVVIIGGIGIRQWARFRAFRAEVFIECLHLWREQLTDYYRRHPELDPIMTIPEEAMYSAMHSEHRQVMYSKAWANVKSRQSKSIESPPANLHRSAGQGGTKRSMALVEFSTKIESWPEEQARTAMLLIKATMSGDPGEIDRLHQELTVAQFRAVTDVLRKMENGG